MRAFYFSHDVLARIAYSEWERSGWPDGDALNRYGWKNKDFHWWIARSCSEILLEMDSEFFYYLQFACQTPT